MEPAAMVAAVKPTLVPMAAVEPGSGCAGVGEPGEVRQYRPLCAQG